MVILYHIRHGSDKMLIGYAMLGAIAGDIIGSIYERFNIRSMEFPLFSAGSRFTDDTVLSVALADSILYGDDYPFLLKYYYRRYPNAGFGGAFHQWAQSSSLEPYNSWGNGSAMRASPVGWAYDTLDEVSGAGRTERLR